MRPHATPLILLSRCLEHDSCRYDGSMVHDPFVLMLKGFAVFETVCPEVEIGLGIPRMPIRLLRDGESGGVRLFQPATGRDLTVEMSDFCVKRLAASPSFDGAILKFRSPSCGISEVRIYSGPEHGSVLGKGPGLFGGSVLAAMGGKPVIHEGRLKSLPLREHFLTGVFTLARFRRVGAECGGGCTMGPLVKFHADAKLLLAAANREEGRRLGRLVAGGGSLPGILDGYREGLVKALSRPLRRGPCVDTLMHAFGHFKKLLKTREKALFLDSLEDYKSGRSTMAGCRSMLLAWIARFENDYLDDQMFFDPFPGALSNTGDSSGGRWDD
jgi:uncharacterized protein YbgA (DUF1722 family)/uncharacterized protein YbbK (DUF523 family)